jgi:hypothetical protein
LGGRGCRPALGQRRNNSLCAFSLLGDNLFGRLGDLAFLVELQGDFHHQAGHRRAPGGHSDSVCLGGRLSLNGDLQRHDSVDSETQGVLCCLPVGVLQGGSLHLGSETRVCQAFLLLQVEEELTIAVGGSNTFL